MDFIDVNPVVSDFSVRNVVEAVEKIGDGGLPGASRADQGHLLPRFGIQSDPVQHGFVLFIGKVHVEETDISSQFRVSNRPIAVRVLPGP